MTSTQAELKRLTVPQLKALCKERKITGYAKLPKDAIIAKLLGASISTPTTIGATAQEVASEAEVLPPVPHAAQKTAPSEHGLVTRPKDLDIQVEQVQLRVVLQKIGPASSAHEADIGPPETSSAGLAGTKASNPNPSTPNVESVHDQQMLKRKRSTALKMTDIPMDPFSPGPDTPDYRGPLLPVMDSMTDRSGFRNTDRSAIQTTTNPSPASDLEVRRSALLNESKRFKPLWPNARGYRNHINVPLFQTSVKRPVETHHSLESSATTIPLLKPITMPVSLNQRKKVPILSIILSMIFSEDLAACSLVSKMFRYAAHLAAYHRLCREFPGRRLSDLMSRHQPATTNMWPYLVQRQEAYIDQRLRYEESFLGKALKGVQTISNALWKNPNHELQVTVALRFLLTRVYFTLSTGAMLDVLDSLEVVVDTQEVVKGEIWKVEVNLLGCRKSFHVVEATCEVIGETRATAEPRAPAPSPGFNLTLRDDWSRYIEERTHNGDISECLWDHLHWTNHEEYTKGMSKLWIKKMSQEGVLGGFKIEVGKRYVLACVMANGISGQWKSSQMMYQEYKGIPDLLPDPSKKKATKLNLFIPEHHNVESLHFTTSDGHDLHRAIAAVQTLNREYYILKDNGMQIGCEEEGISLAWRRLLGCTARGVPR